MKQKIVFLVILVLIGGYFYLRSKKAEIQAAFGKLLGAPSGSYEVHSNWNHGKKTLTYRMKIDYPATSLIQHYDEEFKAKGWTLRGEKAPSDTGKWVFVQGVETQAKEKMNIYRYQCAWIDKKNGKIVKLTLIYEIHPNNDTGKNPPKFNELIVFVEEEKVKNQPSGVGVAS